MVDIGFPPRPQAHLDGIWDSLWGCLGAVLVPVWVPNGSKMVPKIIKTMLVPLLRRAVGAWSIRPGRDLPEPLVLEVVFLIHIALQS